jgi:predicted aconitase
MEETVTSPVQMTLTTEEQAILDGEQGEQLQRAMKTVVTFGELFGATNERLGLIKGAWTCASYLPEVDCKTPVKGDNLSWSESSAINYTNSNTTRAYTSARFYLDDDLTNIIVTGELPALVA